jgi:hypothetical protein
VRDEVLGDSFVAEPGQWSPVGPPAPASHDAALVSLYDVSGGVGQRQRRAT